MASMVPPSCERIEPFASSVAVEVIRSEPLVAIMAGGCAPAPGPGAAPGGTVTDTSFDRLSAPEKATALTRNR